MRKVPRKASKKNEMSASQLRQGLAAAVNAVAFGGERVTLRRHGKPVAAVVSIEDLRLLEKAEDLADIKAAKAAMKSKGSIPWTKIKKDLGL